MGDVQPASIFVGVDGGGTGCRARAVDADGRPLGSATAGPANIYSDLSAAVRNVHAAVAGAVGGADLARCVVGLGLAGANVPAAAAAFLAVPHPFAAQALEADFRTACRGAHGDGDGGVAIVGTGTAYVARVAGRFTEFGGWGFAVSDQGSAGHLGRAALAAALLAHDGLAPASDLTAALIAEFGGPAALADFARHATPADFGRFAKPVMDAADAGDPVAETLVADALAVIEPALARLLALGAPRIVLAGGLAPRYRPRLAAHLVARLAEPQGDALDGALLLARSLAPWR